MMEFHKMFDMTGKNVLITGSSRGIGRSFALGMAEFGANIILHGSRQSESLAETAKQVADYGNKCVSLAADLSSIEDVEKLADDAVSAMGTIDVVILNASMQYKREWTEYNADEIEKQLNVNIKSGLRLIQKLAPPMLDQGWGRILAIGSVNQDVQHPMMSVYAASKSAQLNMVENFARTFAPKGVTVNNLAPGVITTDRNTDALADKDYANKVLEKIPMRRFAHADECVGAALFLCSDAGSYVTGQNIFVSGGMEL